MLPVNKKEKMIYVIGDTQCRAFWAPHFECRYVGPRTAHQLHRHDYLVKAELDTIPLGSKMLFTFGELDCRIHIFDQYRVFYTPIGRAIKNTVNKYLDYISSLNILDCNILSVIPAAEDEGVYDVPFFGTVQERVIITTVFNSVLKIECRHRGFKFIDVFDQLIDKQGQRKAEFSNSEHLTSDYGKLVYKKYFNKEK